MGTVSLLVMGVLVMGVLVMGVLVMGVLVMGVLVMGVLVMGVSSIIVQLEAYFREQELGYYLCHLCCRGIYVRNNCGVVRFVFFSSFF